MFRGTGERLPSIGSVVSPAQSKIQGPVIQTWFTLKGVLDSSQRHYYIINPHH